MSFLSPAEGTNLYGPYQLTTHRDKQPTGGRVTSAAWCMSDAASASSVRDWSRRLGRRVASSAWMVSSQSPTGRQHV